MIHIKAALLNKLLKFIFFNKVVIRISLHIKNNPEYNSGNFIISQSIISGLLRRVIIKLAFYFMKFSLNFIFKSRYKGIKNRYKNKSYNR